MEGAWLCYYLLGVEQSPRCFTLPCLWSQLLLSLQARLPNLLLALGNSLSQMVYPVLKHATAERIFKLLNVLMVIPAASSPNATEKRLRVILTKFVCRNKSERAI